MGTVADKLTYLAGTKDKLKTEINYTGANITNDTFRSYPETLHNKYAEIIKNGTEELLNNLPKSTGIGTSITLQDTIESKIKLEKIVGNTIQGENPSPSNPQEIKNAGFESYNLVDFNKVTRGSANIYGNYSFKNDILNVKTIPLIYSWAGYDITDLIKNNPGKTIRFCYTDIDVSNNPTSGGSSIVTINYTYNDETSSLSQGLLTKDLAKTNRTIASDTSNISTAYLRIYTNNTNTSQEASITIKEPMLIFGTADKPYQPYGNFATIQVHDENSVNTQTTLLDLNEYDNVGNVIGSKDFGAIGDYKNFIDKSTGKNLFDKDSITFKDNYYLSSDGVEHSNSDWKYSDYIKVSCKNITLTRTSTEGSGIAIVAYNSNKEYLTGKAYNNNKTVTLSSSQDISYIRFTLSKTSDNINNIQLEEGSTATAYEPYGTSWYMCRKVKKVVLNGTESWGTTPSSAGNGNRFVSGIVSSLIKPTSSTSEIAKIISNKYNAVSINNTTQSSPIDGIAIAASGNLVIYYSLTKDLTATEFKTWMTTNVTEVLYVLETPEYEILDEYSLNSIKDIENLLSYNGTTYIECTDDVPVSLTVGTVKEYE